MKQKHLILKGVLGLALVFVVLTGCPTDSDSNSNNNGGGGNVPEGVTVAPDNQRLIVSWNAVSGATGYRVAWGMNITEPPATLTNQNSSEVNGITTTYTIPNLQNGNSYSVWVAAKKADHNYSSYSGMKTATPNPSTQSPGKPLVTVTATDNGQLKIDWQAAQYANQYTVRLGTTIDPMYAEIVLEETRNLTYTTTADDLSPPVLIYYVWVTAINTTQGADTPTSSDRVQGTILDAPLDSTALIGTWTSNGGATYTFSGTNSVVFKEDGSATKGEGTFEYDKPRITLNITASGGYQAPAVWNGDEELTVNGKTFTINNITYTKQ
jgi:hypothetical protein